MVFCENERGNECLLMSTGNRVSCFDLKDNTSKSLAFEMNEAIQSIQVQNHLLVVIDVQGAGVLVNFRRNLVLHRFGIKGQVCAAVAFSPDTQFVAICSHRKIQVWRCPSYHTKEFNPMVLHRVYSGHTDDVSSVDWFPDSRYFCTSSKDLTTRVYSLFPEEGFEVVTLSGHNGEKVLGSFFL